MGRISRRCAGVGRGAFKRALLVALLLSLTCVNRQAFADPAQSCDASNPTQVRLQVSVSGLRSTAGNVHGPRSILTSGEHFLDGAYKLARQTVPVTLPVTRVCFAVAGPGYYAVALFHDENENGHFDTTILGVPDEGFGFSNNPTLYLGPPDLAKVRATMHEGDNPVDIKIKYY